jgi:hypothetical protein
VVQFELLLLLLGSLCLHFRGGTLLRPPGANQVPKLKFLAKYLVCNQGDRHGGLRKLQDQILPPRQPSIKPAEPWVPIWVGDLAALAGAPRKLRRSRVRTPLVDLQEIKTVEIRTTGCRTLTRLSAQYKFCPWRPGYVAHTFHLCCLFILIRLNQVCGLAT